MGTRLYPNTTNRANIEILAGVAPGTYDKLDAIKVRHEAEKKGKSHADLYEIEYTQWKEINDNPDLGTLSAFLLYGWGKFDGCGLAEGYSGRLNEIHKVKTLFLCNGLSVRNVDLTEGVYWC